MLSVFKIIFNVVNWCFMLIVINSLMKMTLKQWCVISYTPIQGIHRRMVRFQKLTRNLFLTLQGHNVHRQQQQLSKFLMR